MSQKKIRNMEIGIRICALDQASLQTVLLSSIGKLMGQAIILL
jgi:hypothetical protein